MFGDPDRVVVGAALLCEAEASRADEAALALLPALLGFAGPRVERTRWRGLIAAALVAVALVGVGLEVTPLTLGLPLAAVVLVAGFFVRPLRR